MRTFLSTAFFLAFICCAHAQKISETFTPLIKEAPFKSYIIQYTDHNYLIFGDIDYHENSPCGSLIKVDQQGNLMNTFQKVLTNAPISTVKVLPSGKILINGGFRYVNERLVGNIALLHGDGSLDQEFNPDPNSQYQQIAVQSTGKIIVSRRVEGESYPQLQRLNSDGTRDFSFGTNYWGDIYGILIDETDKIYINYSVGFSQLSENGQVDNSYVVLSEGNRFIQSFDLQPDNKVVAIVGFHNPSNGSATYTLQRFDSDGGKDNTFQPGVSDQPFSAVIRTNGKIAIAGLFTSFDSQQGNAFELNTDGSINRKILTADSNGLFYLYEDSQENIFIAGNFRRVNGGYAVRNVVKLNESLEVDQSFKLPISRTPGTTPYLPVAIQASGKILVGGTHAFVGAESDSSRLVRLLSDGKLDPSFQSPIPYSSSVNALAVQDDDKIVIGGLSIHGSPSPALVRLLPNGQIDNSFEIGKGPSNSNNFPPHVTNIKIANSKIYILGSFDRFNDESCRDLVILDRNGKKIGPQHDELPLNSYFQDLVVQSDGKIIIMGSFYFPNDDYRRFVRLNTDGSVDNTFQLKDVKGNIGDIEIGSDDNIFVGGNYLNYNTKTILLRFKPDGQIDNAFDQGVGFSGVKFLVSYVVKALDDNILAVGGNFSGYQDKSSPGLVLMDNDGNIIPYANPFDSLSFPIVGDYANKCLYLLGRFSKNHKDIRGGAKLLFSPEQNVTNYQVNAISESSISLTWDGDFKGAEKIIIEKSLHDTAHYEVIASTTPDINAHELHQLEEVTPYYFRVTGVNEFYRSASVEGKDTTWIASQVALPAIAITPESFVANWTYIPGTDSCLLQVSPNDFTSFVSGYENLVVKSGSHLVTGLDESQPYQYRVKRFKNGKSSPFSEHIVVNVITDIEESLPPVKVYPNPVKDQLLIELPDISNCKIVIHSMDGRVVGNYEFDKSSSLQINTSSLEQGVFIVTISSKGLTKKMKLVRSY
jgi:uncharacterized delta-60 repeat protein